MAGVGPADRPSAKKFQEMNKGGKDIDICGHCNGKVTKTGKNSEGYQCDCCGFWVHARCEGYTAEEYQALLIVADKTGLALYCTVRSCDEIAKQFLKSIGPLKEQVEKNSKRIEELENKLTHQSSAMENIIVEKTKEQVVEVVDEKIKPVIKENMEKLSNSVKDEIKTAIDDERDRAYRARNVMMVNVPEPREEGDSDQATAERVLGDVFLLDMNEFTIIETTRLHSRQPSRGDNQEANSFPSRLLKVRFQTEEMASAVIRATQQQNHAAEQARGSIRVFRDKSKKERELTRQLFARAEANNQSESDNSRYKWIVDHRNKKVVRVAVPDETPESGGGRTFRLRSRRQ